MDVRCEKCGTEYEFDANRIGANGVTVKCTACGHVFKVRRPGTNVPSRVSTTIGRGPQGREWLVRKPDGQMIAFRELTTLQKWIVEGRIERNDEISKNGETWKRLGNILELEPFFSVYEKAQTLNSMIEHTGGDADPVELRASELLAVDHSLGLAPAAPVAPPNSGAALSARSPSGAGTLPPPGSSAPPGASNGASPWSSADATAAAQPENAAPRRNSVPPPSMPATHAPIDPTAPMTTGFAGPGILERAAPASFGGDALDLGHGSYIDDDPVLAFRRNRRRRRWGLFGVLALFASLGALVALVRYGPADNPVRRAADRLGLLAWLHPDDGVDALLSAADRHAALDAWADQERRVQILTEARAKRPAARSIAAAHATALAMMALAKTQLALDLSRTEPVPQEAVGRARADAARYAKDAESQYASSTQEERGRWFGHARAAVALAGGAFEDAGRALTDARTAETRDGPVAALSAYLSSVHAAGTLATPQEAASNAARRLAAEALSLRPALNRARAWLARLHLERGDLDAAKAELLKVRTTAPGHEEAERLLERIAAAKAAEQEEAAPGPPPPPPPKPKPKQRTFEDWMNLGDRLRERDRTQGALNAYGRAAELRPNSAETHSGKGWCYLDLGRPRVALASFERALRLNDRFADAYYGKAESHRALNETEEAIAAFESYLSRAPNGSERRAAEIQLERLRTASPP